MTERGSRTAQRFEQQVESVVTLILGLSEYDLGAPCRDPRGETIGGVVVHMREGTGQVMRWADTMLEGVMQAPAAQGPGEHSHPHGSGHSHGHDHSHDHSHSHDGSPGAVTLAERDEAMALLAEAGRALGAAVRGLTDSQLDSFPPPAADLSDGTIRLYQVVDFVADDLANHLRYVQDALASRVGGAQEAP
jgi:hypothetical protein